MTGTLFSSGTARRKSSGAKKPGLPERVRTNKQAVLRLA